jgi:hypothetical protein
MHAHRHLSRRQLLASAAAAAALGAARPAPHAPVAAAAAAPFLFIVTATGGASIIDSFLPVLETEVSDPARAAALTVYKEAMVAQPEGSNLRCVRNLSASFGQSPFRSDFELEQFVARHHDDMLVMAVENTSVNHHVAQKRAVTGEGINADVTLAEAVAMAHGDGLPLPNASMSNGGFVERGGGDLPAWARTSLITDPRLFALGTHGRLGVRGAPDDASLGRARAARDRLESLSPFARESKGSRLRASLLDLRRDGLAKIEGADLVRKLLLLESSPSYPLEEYGLGPSPDLEAIRARLPGFASDALQAQAALAFLLARHSVARAIIWGPTYIPSVREGGEAEGTPLAFDYSHAGHVIGQNVNWCRLMKSVDGLIGLLSEQPYGGGSMWDHSLIYVATDFGRTKQRPSGGDGVNFPTGHDLNNGVLLISPKLKGNRVAGGVDPETCLTYGFDPKTGEPDRSRTASTADVYSLICQALGVEFAGRRDLSFFLRS